MAELALSSGDPSRALAFYDEYLEQQGPLVEEAERGRVRALRALGRVADERAAIEGFLYVHPESSYRAEFEARLEQL